MQATGRFKAALTASELQVLQQRLQDALQAVPANSIAWYLGSVNRFNNSNPATGYLKPQHAKLLQSLGSDWVACARGLVWDTPDQTPHSRTLALDALATQLRSMGEIKGWRDEKFSHWHEDFSQLGLSAKPDPNRPEDFRMERAAFRFFGLHSHAVHINGFAPNGHMWCGRRALSKSVDPGMLDNIAAGGLPAGESLFECGVREMAEEAGLSTALARTAQAAGQVRTCRQVSEGWHHETLWVYNLLLPEEVQPQNQDGEVSELMLLSPSEVVQAIDENLFTVDAACVIAQAVLQV